MPSLSELKGKRFDRSDASLRGWSQISKLLIARRLLPPITPGNIEPAKFGQPGIRLSFNGIGDQSSQNRRELEAIPTIASRHGETCPSRMTINGIVNLISFIDEFSPLWGLIRAISSKNGVKLPE